MRALLAHAEALAWPLADEGAFRTGHTGMPVAHKPPRALEERLARHRVNTRASLLCVQAWGEAASIPDHLERCAAQLLQAAGPSARLVVDTLEPGRELLRWRAVSLLLPPAMLLAWVPGAPPRVTVLDRAIAPPGPVADLHLHLTAACRFTHTWEALAAEHQLRPLGRRWPGADGPAWDRAIDAALWLRGLFDPVRSTSLAELDPANHPVAAELLAGDFFGARRRGDPSATERDERLRRRRVAAARLDRAGSFDRRRAEREGAFDVGGGTRDPRSARPEPLVLAQMWRWAACREAEGATGAEGLVVQYLRVQTALFRRIVMDPTTRGLTAFGSQFDRIAGLGVDRWARLRRGLADDAGAIEVGAIEARVAPPATPEALGASVRLLDKAVDTSGRPGAEKGIVLHLIRTPPAPRGGAWAGRAAPLSSLTRRAAAEAERVANWFRRRPDLLHHVRGLDLAGDEQAGPLWVMAAPLQRVLDAATEASARTAHRPPNGRVPPPRLGVTLHAGEDFDHLLTGLRAVAEVLERKLVRRGDRIGHALAVLTDAGPWVESHRRVVVRKVDRLLDLCWVISEARKAGWPLPPGALAAWEEERDELGHSLFPPSEAGRRASRGARSSGREAHPHRPGAGTPGGWCADAARGVLRAWRNPHLARSLLSGPPPEEPGPQLFYRWLHHRSDPKGPADPLLDEVVEVGAEPAPGALAAIQQVLRQRLARAQICVESNPTSNLLIGALHAPVDLPGLAPLTVDDDPGAIPVAFAADDPLSFETSLADEYAYAWAGFVTLGRLTPERARERLAQAAAASWRFRFTLPGG